MPQVLKDSVLVSDLHLTDASRDAYRWEVWSQIRAVIKAYKSRFVFILGDLTDAKDNHSAVLVNRMVNELVALVDMGPEVFILRGNHDGLDPRTPYFGFLDKLVNVNFFSSASAIKLGEGKQSVLMLPHHPYTEADFVKLKADNPAIGVALAHITVNGSASAIPGAKALSGIPVAAVEALGCPVYSGDVHKPQRVGPVYYLGSPYHTNFGDDFAGALYYTDATGKLRRILTDLPKRVKLDCPTLDDLHTRLGTDVEAGDQLKVSVELEPEQVAEWLEIDKSVKKAINDVGAELISLAFRVTHTEVGTAGEKTHKVLTSVEAFEHFCETKGLTPLVISAGRECFAAADGSLE